MSMANQYITCTGCDFQGLFQYRPIRLIYRLLDGIEVEAGRTFGWCALCKKIRDIELLIDEQQIRAQLEGLRKQARSPSLLVSKAFCGLLGGRANELKEEIYTLENQLRLAVSRRSRPRCLACSGEGAQSLSFDNHGLSLEFVHECGGRLKLEPLHADAVRFSYKPETVFLDHEGRRISP